MKKENSDRLTANGKIRSARPRILSVVIFSAVLMLQIGSDKSASVCAELPQVPVGQPEQLKESSPDSANAYFSRGMQRWLERDLEGSIADFTKAIELDPNHVNAYFRRAGSLLSNRQIEQAIADYGKVIELDPKNYGAYLNRSNLLRNRGDIVRAKVDLDAAITLQPDSPYAYQNRGILHWESGNTDKALTDLNKSLELQPDNGGGYLSRGLILASLRKFPAAYKDFDRAFELDPNLKNGRRADPEVIDHYTEQGVRLADSGDLDGAIVELNKAIVLGGPLSQSASFQVSPHSKLVAVALGNRGLTWLRKENETEAKKDFTESLKLDPGAKSWLEDQVRSSGLQITLFSVVEEFDLVFNDASLNFRQGQYEKAIKLYKKANSLKENKNLKCLWGLAQTYNKLGAYKNVQRTCETLIKACGDNRGYRARAWNLIGHTLSNNAMKNPDKPDQEKLREAEHAYREVLLASSGAQMAHYNLGVTLIRMNQTSEGIEEMRSCIRLDGDEEIAEKARKTIEDPRRAVLNFSPDFSMVTSDGEYITSDKLRGKVVLLDFWGAWCGPCRSAIPDLKRLAKKYSGEEFILISVDFNDPQEVWLEFLEENKMDWTQVRDDRSTLVRTFQVKGYPTYILIDHEGIIRYRMMGGGSETYSKISNEVKKALKNLEKSAVAGLQRK